MPNFKSSAAYQSWLAYGHANGLFENTPGNQNVSIKGKKHDVKHELALGGPIPGVHPGTPYPYFMFAGLSTLPKQTRALGGPTVIDENILGSVSSLDTVPGSLYAGLGTLGADLVGGNTFIGDNREKGVAEGTLSGALQGAGQGASMGATLGSIVPGVGNAIGAGVGAGVGAIVGGIKGNKNKKQEISDFGKSMELRNASLHPLATTYKAAYGANLHDMPEQAGLKGDPNEYNGQTHEEGGIPVGNVEVEDGEIRVGDYVFSDRLIDPETNKSYADLAKKVTRKFAEYPNDGPAKRAQEKALKDIQFKNDQARLAKQKADAEMQMSMEQDYAAYGAMISKDDSGKYIVDKENRLALLEAAKAKKMSYNSYIDNLYVCGGNIKAKMASGGHYPNPADLYSSLNLPNEADNLSFTDFPGFELPSAKNNVGEFNPNYDASMQNLYHPKENTSDSQFAFHLQDSEDDNFKFPELPIAQPVEGTFNPEYNARKILTGGTPENYDLDPNSLKTKPSNKLGVDEAALLASNLPALQNLINSTKHGNTTFDRAHLNTISLEAERQGIKDAILRGRNIQRENIRNTATSAGDALASLSVGNAGLTAQEISALRESYANEANTNVGIKNQEALTNTDIANQEMIARQQDQAMRASIRNLALSDIGSNAQGYMKDKTLRQTNLDQNTMLMSLLKTGEYELVEDGKRGFTVKYKGAGTTSDTKK